MHSNIDCMIAEVTDKEGLEQIEKLACLTWHEHYGKLLAHGQIDYMLKRFLTVDAMARQMEHDNYTYYLIEDDNTSLPIGFMALQESPGALFLSKIYLLKEFRGKGYGSQGFDFANKMAEEKGAEKVWLTVNKHNTGSYEIYLKRGYKVVKEEVTDIGEGYVMDDYIMELKLN